MAQLQDEVISRIRLYAAEARDMQDQEMDMDATSTEARLNETLRELQARVKEQQAALAKVHTQYRTLYEY